LVFFLTAFFYYLLSLCEAGLLEYLRAMGTPVYFARALWTHTALSHKFVKFGTRLTLISGLDAGLGLFCLCRPGTIISPEADACLTTRVRCAREVAESAPGPCGSVRLWQPFAVKSARTLSRACADNELCGDMQRD
jgi:hypothetical protein